VPVFGDALDIHDGHFISIHVHDTDEYSICIIWWEQRWFFKCWFTQRRTNRLDRLAEKILLNLSTYWLTGYYIWKSLLWCLWYTHWTLYILWGSFNVHTGARVYLIRIWYVYILRYIWYTTVHSKSSKVYPMYILKIVHFIMFSIHTLKNVHFWVIWYTSTQPASRNICCVFNTPRQASKNYTSE
jgi:hypothetical protein